MKTSEKRLLSVFVGLLFVAGNLFLYELVKSRRDQVELQRGILEERRVQLEELLGERATWQDRRDWIDGKLKGYQTIDVRDTFLVSLINESAVQAGVTVDKGPNPLAARDEGTYEETLVDAEVVGLIEPVVKFLFLLQEPTAFRSITSLQMEPARRGDDSEEIRCEVTVAQRWARGFAAGEAGFTSPDPTEVEPGPEPEPEPEESAAMGEGEGEGDGDGVGEGADPAEPGSSPAPDATTPSPVPGQEPPAGEGGDGGGGAADGEDPERLTAAVVQPLRGGDATATERRAGAGPTPTPGAPATRPRPPSA